MIGVAQIGNLPTESKIMTFKSLFRTNAMKFDLLYALCMMKNTLMYYRRDFIVLSGVFLLEKANFV